MCAVDVLSGLARWALWRSPRHGEPKICTECERERVRGSGKIKSEKSGRIDVGIMCTEGSPEIYSRCILQSIVFGGFVAMLLDFAVFAQSV